MSSPTTATSRTNGPRSKARGPAVAALTFLICALYLWTASSSGNPFGLAKAPRDYYALLTQAFIEGHLDLDRTPAPGLLALADPYDNFANRPYRLTDVTHDLSLYRGRFYLYFGAAPAVVLFVPFRLITGRYLPENLALALLSIGVFLASLRIVRGARSDLPRSGAIAELLIVALLGLCNYAIFLLRRPRTYEVAIAAGAFFALLGVDALLRGIREKRGVGWLCCAGACFGLAFSSRPTQGMCAALMTVASVLLLRRDGRPAFRRVASMWSPWLAAIALVLLYNQARFERPLEFGMRYQLTEWNQREATLFSPAFLPFNAWLNLLAPPMIGPEFPFFQLAPANPGLPPPGHQAVEGIAGLIPCLPVVLVVALWPLWLRRRGALEWTGLVLALQAMLIAVIVLCFAVATVRYQWDFLPLLLISAALAWIRLLATFETNAWARRLVTATLFVTVAYSSALNLGVGLTGYYDWLKDRNPVVYEALEDAFLPIQRAWLGLGSGRFGTATLRIRFKEVLGEGQLEALLAAGGRYRHDVVCVRYTADEQAIFRFHHRGTVPIRSQPIRLARNREHVVEIEMGSLIPVNARVFARLEPAPSPREGLEHFSIRVDGAEVLNGRFDFIPAMPQQVSVGMDRIDNDQCPTPFGGSVVSVTRSLSLGERR